MLQYHIFILIRKCICYRLLNYEFHQLPKQSFTKFIIHVHVFPAAFTIAVWVLTCMQWYVDYNMVN